MEDSQHISRQFRVTCLLRTLLNPPLLNPPLLLGLDMLT
uniref:Uncharacterized protein n=1 Tax=Arundo donax TaxID=35708 RepID=A0A0A8YG87_ARUDO